MKFEKLNQENCQLTQGQKASLFGSGCSTVYDTDCGDGTTDPDDGWDSWPPPK